MFFIQHLRLKLVISGSRVPATTSAAEEHVGQESLECVAVIREDITALKPQTQKDKRD